jgi:hypothetical protein
MGIRLYPIFPVAPNTYLHFANPFRRIGIEIAYKGTPPSLLERKKKLLSTQGWTVYSIASRDCYHTLDEFFSIKREIADLNWNDLSFEMQQDFFKKYHLENSGCLLSYIKQRHLQKQTHTTD